MKTATFQGDKAELNEELEWEAKNKKLQHLLNQATDMVMSQSSPAAGDLRQYVFSSVIRELDGEVLADDEGLEDDGNDHEVY